MIELTIEVNTIRRETKVGTVHEIRNVLKRKYIERLLELMEKEDIDELTINFKKTRRTK